MIRWTSRLFALVTQGATPRRLDLGHPDSAHSPARPDPPPFVGLRSFVSLLIYALYRDSDRVTTKAFLACGQTKLAELLNSRLGPGTTRLPESFHDGGKSSSSIRSVAIGPQMWGWSSKANQTKRLKHQWAVPRWCSCHPCWRVLGGFTPRHQGLAHTFQSLAATRGAACRVEKQVFHEKPGAQHLPLRSRSTCAASTCKRTWLAIYPSRLPEDPSTVRFKYLTRSTVDFKLQVVKSEKTDACFTADGWEPDEAQPGLHDCNPGAFYCQTVLKRTRRRLKQV